MFYTVDMVYTVKMVYTVDVVDTVDTFFLFKLLNAAQTLACMPIYKTLLANVRTLYWKLLIRF